MVDEASGLDVIHHLLVVCALPLSAQIELLLGRQRALVKRLGLVVPPAVSRVIVATGRPVTDPRKCSNAGPKSLLDKPCKYSSGNTSATCGDLCAHRW